MRRSARRPCLLMLGCFGASLASCSTPFSGPTDGDLKRSIVDSTQRELAEAERRRDPVSPPPSPDRLNFSEQRLRELDDLSGRSSYGDVAPPLGMDLLGEETRTVPLALREAVSLAVSHNLEIQLARLDAAATQTEIVAAEAVFDWVLFGSASFGRTDQPAAVPVINGVPVGSAINRNHIWAFETGIRSALTTGGEFQIAQSFDIFDNRSPGRDSFPDPARSTALEIALDQPLLRGFGSDVALAEVRLARNLERSTIEQLRANLIDVVTRTEQAYWSLVLAYRDVQIAQRLLDRGVETRDVLKGRLEFDVRPAEYSDAVAQVESRRAEVIRLTNELRSRSDELKILLNDPSLTVGGEVVIVPSEDPPAALVEFNLFDSITTAFASRPEVQQAILAIDDASIRELVADNARLPRLNLQLAATLHGLGDTAARSFDQLGEADFVDYFAGLGFEQPIGNRAASAAFRRSRLERMRSVVAYRSTAQRVVAEVKAALRDVVANHQLIEQTRIARLAAAENLRTLLIEEENIRGLTPDFLDLKLRRQDALAAAERAEVRSLVEYNIAIAQLHAATGSTLPRNQIRFIVPSPGETVQTFRSAADVRPNGP